jgi:anti-anti-sigma factor
MKLKVSNERGYVLARAIGRIDESAEPLFQSHLFSLVGLRGMKVVLDFSEVDFISSKGLGLLVRLVAHANTNSSRVVLAACRPYLAIVFDRCKLGTFLEIVDSVPEAAQRFEGE